MRPLFPKVIAALVRGGSSNSLILLFPLLVFPLPAIAAVVSDHVSFSADSFSVGGTVPLTAVPVDPVFGSFDITFDPTISVFPTVISTGITLTSLNIAFSFPLTFSYNPTLDSLTVGGHAGGLVSGTNDFGLRIDNFLLATPTFIDLLYANAGDQSHFFSSFNGTVSVTPIASPVPELSTWLMMILGFACTGFMAYQRKTRQTFSISLKL